MWGFRMTVTIQELTDEIIKFRDVRDWQQFHTLKNLMISLSLEASELLEIAQWKDEEKLRESLNSQEIKTAISDECADIFIFLLLVCRECDIDPKQATLDKLVKNDEKYPIDKAYGSAKKYTEL